MPARGFLIPTWLCVGYGVSGVAYVGADGNPPVDIINIRVYIIFHGRTMRPPMK